MRKYFLPHYNSYVRCVCVCVELAVIDEQIMIQ